MESLPTRSTDQQYPKSGSERPLGLTRRKYLAGLRDLGDREWSVPVGEPPQRWFVPLGTTDEAKAVRVAEEIKGDLAAQGWIRIASRVPHEFAFGIFWLESPLAVTYVTLFTLPKARPTPAPAGTSPAPAFRLRIAVIEPDPVLRASLMHWLGSIPGCTCVAWESESAWFQQTRRRPDLDLLLVNRLGAAFVAGRFRPHRRVPELPLVFGYGIYPTSDDIFASVTGVEAGYYLRRRQLTNLMEPLGAAFQEGCLQPEGVGRTLRRYFQNVFTLDAEQDSLVGGLTSRERQILACIQRGLRDKEIATTLGISPLTVHTHLKHIFHKLGAHTRTEAVVKFLEK
ncbi:MAG: response regulator transcription factor [Verrucomicrobiae bacterium]|nr:response regulator transcription factor [Verrucomicrobiae bacterium]